MNIEKAMFSSVLPCNSIATANRLIELLEEHNTNSLEILKDRKDDRITSILWLLNAQYYGGCGVIDLYEQFGKLYALEQLRDDNRRQAIKDATHVGG